MAKNITNEQAVQFSKTQARSLHHDYPSVTVEIVREAIEKWRADNNAKPVGIIEMIVFNTIKNNL